MIDQKGRVHLCVKVREIAAKLRSMSAALDDSMECDGSTESIKKMVGIMYDAGTDAAIRYVHMSAICPAPSYCNADIGCLSSIGEAEKDLGHSVYLAEHLKKKIFEYPYLN